MRWICVAVMTVALASVMQASAHADHKSPLYRGGIAWNDYGHGPTGGYHAAIRNNRLAANGWSGYGGYSSYRPYYNNWSGNLSVNIGRPYGYSSFGYYNGPAYGYASPYYGGYYGSGLDYYYGPGTGYYRSGLGYYGLGAYDYGYSTYYNPRSSYVDYYLPPVYYPAELNYGPQAVKQFLGVDRTFGLGPLLNNTPQVNQPIVIDRSNTVREAAKPVVKEINWEARKKADRFIEIGDQRFQEQKFHDALLRYKMAIEASPDYAVAHLRHGFSLIGNRRYEEAAVALKKAFTLDSEIVKSGFRIDQLYDDNRLARQAHEEGLAQAVLDAPSSGDLHFVMGMWLVFSGDLDRSRKFFEKARELGVDSGVVAQAENAGRDL